MKEISSKRKNQQIWEHEGQRYSVIDRAVFPDEVSPGDEPLAERFQFLMKQAYGAAPIEVARFEEGGHVTVLGRYPSFNVALDAIESGDADLEEGER